MDASNTAGRTVETDADSHKMGEHTVSLPDGVRVRTIDEGSGPTLLLLHGNPDNADEWKPLIKLLRGSFRCIAPDLPGYGRRGSTYTLPESFDYSLEAQVGFVDAFLADLGIHGKITLLVHDIGGIMGVPWAARNAGRLSAVVYTNTFVFPKTPWFKLARRWGKDTPVGRGVASLSMSASGWFGGSLFRSIFSKQNPQLNKQELDRFVVNFASNTTAKRTTLVEFRKITTPGFFDGYDQMLKTIAGSAPTAALWGSGDPYISDQMVNELMARETTVLPGVGHWVAIVATEVLAKKILSLREGP